MNKNNDLNEKRILGWTKYEFGMVWMFFLMWGTIFLDRLVMPFLAPMVMEDLSITDPQYGLINTFTTGCYAIAAIALTPVLERTGKRKLWLILLCLGAGVFACIGALTQDVWQLLITRAAVGFFEGPIAPLMFATMVGASTPSRLALNPGIINGGVSVIAVGIGPALVVNIALASTWRMGFVVAGVISIIVSLCLIKILRNDNHIPEEKKTEPMFKMIGKLLKVRNVVLSFFLGIMIMVVYWTQMLYATLFFSTVGGQNMANAGAIVSFMGIAGVAWTIIVPKLSDLIGRKPASILWFGICAIAPYAMFGAPSSVGAMVLYIIFAAIPGSLFPMFQAVIPGESLPNYMLGTAIGMILGVAEIVGGSIWPAVAGFVADAYGYPTVIMAAGIAATVGLIIALFLKETKGKGFDAKTL